VAVVTGAARGIGRGTALSLARAGAQVVAGARDLESLTPLVDEIDSEGGRATGVACDVTDPEQVEGLFYESADLGGVSILVCAAGILTKGPFAEISLDDWHRTIEVNLTGTFLCCRAAFAQMKQGAGGRIVNISSLSGIYATEKFPGLVAYNCSKYGVVGLTEGIAVEGREFGISAICVSPGAVDTDMLRHANPDLRPGLGPEDVGRLIVALLDDDLAAASGANIPLFSNL
jgi:NAD(P)-dependent dehydrogenase (short-subunit alcohol dehydrogenase family)